MLSRCTHSLKSRGLATLKNKQFILQAEHQFRHYHQHKILLSRYTSQNHLTILKSKQHRPYILGVCYASTDSVDQILEDVVNNITASPPSETIHTVRKNSQQSSTSDVIDNTSPSSITESIPEPPPIPEFSPEIINEATTYAGEPPFESIGLGGWTPVGLVQNCLEYFHIGLDMPWWLAIVVGTICVRILIFPLVIVAQRNAAKMNNHLPKLQEIQLKMTEARQTGNQLDAAKYAQEMMVFMKEKQVNPFKNMLVPLAQMPLFISFFMGLRGMSNVPVDSMRTGGMLWFTDLTLPDQFYLLPILTSLTMWITIEVGTDSARLSSSNLQTMRYVLRALPVCILPFTVNFPGAILCYWVATNFISLIQVGFLRIPSVRTYFKIDPLITHSPETLPVKPKPFIQGMKDSWNNMKIAKEMEERERFDDMQFQRAGRGPVVKTYKYDPTKSSPPSSNAAISAKKRDY